MPNLNRVLLMGHLTRDPETKAIPSGTTVTHFGIAVNRKFSSKSGEKREEVLFVDVTAWAGSGDAIAKYLKKGDAIFVDGYLKLDEWVTKEGVKRSKISVVVDSFEFVGGKKQDRSVQEQTPLLEHGDMPF